MAILVFIFGLIMGSFYLVIAMRETNNESIIKPRSHCEYCNHFLAWYELIPIISYIVFKGKCSKCQHKLSILYPLTELFTGLLFLISYLKYGISYEFFSSIIICSLLIIIFITDFKYLIILDRPLFISIILIIILKYLYFGLTPMLKSIISALLIFSFLYIIKLIGDKVFKRESLGGGDIKLGLFMGAVLGIRLALSSIVIGSFIALPYATYYIIKKQDREIPFGPFLILAVLICFMFMNPINNFINMLFLIN